VVRVARHTTESDGLLHLTGRSENVRLEDSYAVGLVRTPFLRCSETLNGKERVDDRA